jgi:hypothetical protein
LRHTDWADHLIHIEAAMNNPVNQSSKPKQDVPAVTDYIQKIQDNIAITRDRKTKQTTYVNKQRRPEPNFKK